MKTDAIAERVRRGALRCDVDVVGWAGKIDQERLDLSHPHKCILGQACGSYHIGLTRLGLNFAEGKLHGFAGTHWPLRNSEFAALRAAWLLEIRARLDVAPEPVDMPAWATDQNAPELMA